MTLKLSPTKKLSQNAVRQAHRERNEPCNPFTLSLSKGAAKSKGSFEIVS